MSRATVDHTTATPEAKTVRAALTYLKAEMQSYVDDPADPSDLYEMGYQAALETVLIEAFGIRISSTVKFHKINA